MSTPQRRLTHEESIGKLMHRLPGVEKVFKAVHLNRPGDSEYKLWATMPYINSTAWANTISAYKLKVMVYNQQAATENRTIKKQIRAGKLWAEKQPKPEQETIVRTQVGFEQKNRHLSIWEYNKKVEAYNNLYGNPIVPKKKIATIKPSTQQVFEAFLWEYNNQLKQLRDLRSKNGKSWYSPLHKMEVNTKHLENATGAHGIRLLSFCPDTILNHKNRLIEAGILLNNEFKGSKRGTLHHISDEILMIYDDFDQKLIYTENQLLTKSKPEVFRDAVIPTRANNKQIVKRGIDKSNPFDKDKGKKPLHNSNPTDSSTRAPIGKMQNPKTVNTAQKNKPGENFTETEYGPSTHLLEKIETAASFSKKLSQNTALSLNEVSLEILEKEVSTGTLSRSDFRIVLIQLLFARFSTLYLKHPHFHVIFTGVWLKTYQVWLNSKVFCTKNGELLQKNTMLVHYRELCYCIENKQWGVSAWIKKGSFVPPNPFIYLNPNNATKGTFAHHFYRVKKQSPKAFIKIRKIVNTAKAEGKKATEYQKYIHRLNRKFAQLFNGKITDAQVVRYVRDNMPPEVQQNFQKHFDNYRNNRLNTHVTRP